MRDQLKQAIIDGNADTATALTSALIATGASAREILDEALLPGMDVVGNRMRDGDCFIPEVLLSARVMQACLDQNLVGMLLQGAGFTVVNLGTGVTSADFVAAVKEHSAKILGMSALLTTTLPHMSETIALLKEAGLRQSVKVMVGGAPVTAAYAEEIGADGYGANAGMAVERAKELVS